MGQANSTCGINQPSGSLTLQECPGGLLGIVSTVRGRHLVALRPIAAGQEILWIDGVMTTEPSRYSVQVGHDEHVVPGIDISGCDSVDHGFWRYLNHSCDPNGWLRGRELIALRDIQPNENVTFDYNSSEWDMAEPFACHCTSARCLGTIRGFRHLSPTQREQVQTAAPHLTAHIACTDA